MTAQLYSGLPLSAEFTRNGLGSKTGMVEIQYLPAGCTSIGDFDNSGWRALGILDGEFIDDSTIETYIPDTGNVGVQLGVVATKETIQKTISLLAAIPKAEALAYGQNNPTVTYPTSANATDVDESTPIATNFVIKLTAVTGSGTAFAVGDIVEIETGSTDYADKEYCYVRAVDTTAKTITIVPPVGVIPADTANVKTVGNLALTRTAGSLADGIRLRFVKHNKDEASVTITAYPEVKVTGGKLSAGTMSTPAKGELTFNVIPERNTGLNKYVLSRRKTIYKA